MKANISFAILIAFLSTSIFSFGQDKEAEVKSMVESKRFIFRVQSALPSSGAVRQLAGGDYDLKVLNDSVISYLPYFGRAYSAPYSPNDGGYKFTSTNNIYTVKPRRKGGWDIKIKIKDVTDFREFNLTLSTDGYGTLQALNNSRQPISYTGSIESMK